MIPFQEYRNLIPFLKSEERAVSVDDLPGGTTRPKTVAGLNVETKDILGIPAVGQALLVISEGLAVLPVKVMQGKQQVSHPIESILMERANDDFSAFDFRRRFQTDVMILGNGFAEIQRTRRRGLVGLRHIPFQGQVRYKDRVYEFTEENGKNYTLRADEVFHVSRFGRSKFGIDIVSQFREYFGTDLALYRFVANFYKRGNRLGNVISPDEQVKLTKQQQEQLQEAWNMQEDDELSQDFGSKVLPFPVKTTSLTSAPGDRQLPNLLVYGVQDVARIFNIPPTKLQDLSRATYSNIETENREFANETLLPWAKNWAAQLAFSLLPTGMNLRIEFDLSHMLMGNIEDRANWYEKGIQNGWLSPNEVRETEDMNPRPDGDVYVDPRDKGASNVGQDRDQAV